MIMEPISWTKACDIIDTNKLEDLKRNEEDEEHYISCMNNIKKQYNSVTDFIYHSIFKYPVKINENNKLVASVGSVGVPLQYPILTLNNYPYYFEKNISHYILWNTKELNEQEIIDIIENELSIILNKSTIVKKKDYHYWVNPIVLKSIKDIWHAHIIVNK